MSRAATRQAMTDGTNHPVRCCLYARVSTQDQSCEMQLQELREYCLRRGWSIVGEFVDIGVSGAKDSRPELDKLMRVARQRGVDVVVVWRFDRFARSVKHLVMALEEFQSLGIGFVSYQEALDTSAPIGKAMFTIIGAMAELERNVIRERVRAGIRNARRNGKQLGRKRVMFDRGRAMELHEAGAPIRHIAMTLGVNRGVVHRFLLSRKPATKAAS